MKKGIVIAAVAVLLLINACTKSVPTVSIVAPKNNDTLSWGNVPLRAYATDKSGVTQVEFYVGAALTGTVTTGTADTFSYVWDDTGATEGAHKIKAVAYNTAGKTAADSITVVLTSVPAVSILAPTNNDTLNKGNIPLKAYATDQSGVTKVVFSVDATAIDTATTGTADTFSYVWNASGVTNGAHTVKATAYNAGGNTASASINIVLTGIHTSDITADSTWYPSDNPHIIGADIGVYNNATLTIMPGCVVKFNPGYDLYVGDQSAGAIIAAGKADSTILFTSNATTPNKGDWNDIGVYENTLPTTKFAYCTFQYGGKTGSGDGEIFVRGNTVVKLDNCKVAQSGDYGIVCDNNSSSFASLTNDTITTCTKYPIYINPNNVKAIGAGCAFTGNASGFDGIWVQSGTGPDGIIANATWLSLDVPYLLSGNVEVAAAAGPALTIAPGALIQLANHVEFYCGYSNPGAIIADSVTFTSILPSPAPGSWSDIGLYSQSTAGTLLSHCKIEDGGSISNAGDIYINNTSAPVVQDDSIGYSGAYGIYLDGGTYPNPDSLQADNTFYHDSLGNIYHP